MKKLLKHIWGGEKLLEVKNIDVSYGPFLVLHNVSLKIETGEIVAVLGPNGAGKTTLLRAISGMLPVRNGSIFFEGIEITGLKPHEIAQLGLVHVPEGKQIFSNLTVIENLKMASYVSYARKKRKDNLQIVFNIFPVLKERMKQKAGTLSGGERQMLCIAMGLMNNPKLLLLDEPSQGLAPKIVLELFGKIRELCKSYNISVLLVEQQVAPALSIASRGYLLVNGRIILEESTDELRKSKEIQKYYLTM